MPLATRIIPVLLKRGTDLVKGVRFDSSRIVGHALQAARIHQARGVDELMILDVGATPAGKGPDFASVEKLTKDCFVPLTIGGGIRSVDDIRDLLNAGADRVVIETVAMNDPGLISDAAAKVGSQAIVVSVSYTRGFATSHCGTMLHTIGALEAAEQAVALGAGEILLQSIDLDGTMKGYDTGTLYAVAKNVPVPVIASCGAGEYMHMLSAINCGANAVAAGAMFQFTDQTPMEAAAYLAKNGVEVRIPA